MTERTLTLKDMTRGAGCTPRTVRYYERQGILRAARSAGGHRLFATSELERLNFVVALREAGWALEEIVELLGAREAGPSDRAAVERLDSMLQRHTERLEKKLEDDYLCWYNVPVGPKALQPDFIVRSLH